jgi:uncharacterized protein YejL (UPF0352 family)
MGVSVKVVHQNASASSGNDDYTSTDFGTPKAALIFMGQGLVDGTAVAHGMGSIGFYDGTNVRNVSSFYTDAVGTSITDRYMNTSVFVNEATSNQGSDRTATVSFITDGIRLNWSGAGSTHEVTVVLFTGSDLTAGVGSASLPSTGSADIDVGFTPDVVFMMSTSGSASGWSTNAQIMFGCAVDDGSETQRAVTLYSADADFVSMSSQIFTENSISSSIDETSISREHNVTAFISGATDGFTVAQQGPNDYGVTSFYLALEFNGAVNFGLDTLFIDDTDSGDKALVTGFTPQAYILAGANSSTKETLVQYSAASFGASDGTTSGSMSMADDDAAAAMICDSVSDAKPIHMLEVGGASDVVADHKDFAAAGGGITFDVTTEETTAGTQYFVLSIEEEAGGTTRNFVTSILGQSITPDDISVSILRSLVGGILGNSITPDNISIQSVRNLIGQISGSSITPDNISVSILRQFLTNISGSSITPDDVTATMTGLINFIASILGQSVTPDNISVSILRQFLTNILGQSVTPDDASVVLSRFFASNIVGGSLTPNNVTATISRGLTADILGQSITPDDVTATIAGLINFIASILGQSITPDDISVITTRLLTGDILGQSTTSDNITATIIRDLIGNISGQSITPDDITAQLLNLISFSASVLGQSITPDDISTIIARSFIGNIQAQSVTPDDITAITARLLTANIIGASITPTDLILILEGLGVIVDPTIESLTVQRALSSLTLQRVLNSLTTSRTIEET